MATWARAVQDTCDSFWSEYYHRVLFVLVGAMVFFTGTRGYDLAVKWDQWSIGEWLASYSSGFVRRGLSGELLLAASASTGVPLNLLVFIATFILFASFCLLFAQLLRRTQITFWYLFLCLSPAFLLFTFYNPDAIGRQEILVYVAFMLWGYGSTRRIVSRPGFQVVFGTVCLVATLVHELFFLFTPYFVFLSVVLFKLRRTDEHWKHSLLVPASSLAAVLAIVLFSRSLDDAGLCQRLLRAGAPIKVCDGLLAYGDPGARRVLMDFLGRFDSHTLVGLGLIFPIILLPVYLFFEANGKQVTSPWTLIGIVCGFILFSSPLFILAVDWGRWISIHTVLLTITCAYLLGEREYVIHQRVRAVHGRAVHLLLGVLVISSTLCWNVKYCCGDRFFNMFGPIHTINNALHDEGI